jgi:hypothetical protein
MVSKCYLDSEGESEWLDLPFFIEFDLTSVLLIRYQMLHIALSHGIAAANARRRFSKAGDG